MRSESDTHARAGARKGGREGERRERQREGERARERERVREHRPATKSTYAQNAHLLLGHDTHRVVVPIARQ